MPPVHPGNILLDDFIKPRGISQYRASADAFNLATYRLGFMNGLFVAYSTVTFPFD